MRLIGINPTTVQIHDPDPKELLELRASLTYRDKKVQYELFKHKKADWFRNKNPMGWEAKLEDLKSREVICLLKDTKDPNIFETHSGITHVLEKKYSIGVGLTYSYPRGSTLPWAKVPDKIPYPYQQSAFEELLHEKHARVEMGTGLGKSFIILNLVRELGLKTVVMAPSTSIADQLYSDFVKHLGKKYVGAYYDGKKEAKKLIVIGNAQSLTRVEEGSDAWELLKDTQVFIADESHLCPAATLVNVCFGLVKGAPWRFFFSATQMRNDGLDLLLDAITGPTVYRMTVREGVDGGYLARPHFRMIKTRSESGYQSEDANEMTRKHLFYNPVVLQQIAEVVNLSVDKLGHQVLILIDEVEQFTQLLPLLRHQVAFAHGPLQATQRHANGTVKVQGNLEKVPEAYRDSDPNALVDSFNACEFPILVGTSCISTGTDIRSVKTCIYWKGGKSEIEVKQGIGRCTRKIPGKTACTIVDFDVENIGILSKHALARRDIYEDIYGPVEEVTW